MATSFCLQICVQRVSQSTNLNGSTCMITRPILTVSAGGGQAEPAPLPLSRIEGRAGITELCVARNGWVVCSSTMSGKRHEPSVRETPLPWKRR